LLIWFKYSLNVLGMSALKIERLNIKKKKKKIEWGSRYWDLWKSTCSMDYGGLESGVMESLRYKYFPQFENLVVWITIYWFKIRLGL